MLQDTQSNEKLDLGDFGPMLLIFLKSFFFFDNILVDIILFRDI